MLSDLRTVDSSHDDEGWVWVEKPPLEKKESVLTGMEWRCHWGGEGFRKRTDKFQMKRERTETGIGRDNSIDELCIPDGTEGWEVKRGREFDWTSALNQVNFLILFTNRVVDPDQ
jgi:hypothetical protein